MNSSATTLTTLAEQLKPYVAEQVRAYVGRSVFQQGSVSAVAGGSGSSHEPVTAGDTSLTVGIGQVVSVRRATDSGLEVSEGLRLGTPTTITAGGANGVTGASHAHAVSTGAPGTIQPDATALEGTSAALARADHRHAIAAATAGAVSLAANAEGSATSFSRSDHRHQLDVTIAPTWTGVHTHGANVLLGASATLAAHDWASGVRGWGIQHDGRADFRAITADELVVKAFIADLEQALAGGQIITKSVVLLGADWTIPDYLGTTQITVEPFPGFPTADVFAVEDYLRVRTISRTAGLVVGDCWLQVGSQVSKTDAAQVYNVTRLPAGAGGLATPGLVVYRGSVVLDYGQSGDGYWEVTALDQNHGPYAQIVTWETTPTNRTVRARLGQLSGMSFASGDEWGLFAGDYAGGNYLRASTAGLHLHAGGGSHLFDENGLTIHESGDTYIYRYYDTKARLVSEDYVREVDTLSINRTIVVRNNGYSHTSVVLRADDQATGRAFSDLYLGSARADLYGPTLYLGYTDHTQAGYEQDRLLIGKNIGVRVYYDGLAVGNNVSCVDDGWVKVQGGIIPNSAQGGQIGTASAVWDQGWFATLHATTVSYTNVTSESQTISGDMNAGNGTLVVVAASHRVGINKASPLSALDVNGDGRFSGVLYASGGRAVSGNVTVSGTVDGVDVGALKSAYDAHAHGAGDPTQVSHASLTNVTANQHHNQVHALSGADHTAAGLTVGQVLRAAGTSSFAWAQLQHADLGGVSANQHHNQAHTLSGADHTASGLTTGWVLRASGATTFAWVRLSHADLGGVSANQHHNQVHALAGADHTASGLTVGHVLRASGASAFSWAQLSHADLGGVTAEQHHALVTAADTSVTVTGQAVNVRLATNPGLEVSSGLRLGTPGGLTASTTNATSGASHTHAVATGTPGAIQPGDAAAAGTSTSLARADHLHAIAAGTPGSVTLASNAAGVATSFARSDHHHHLDQSIAPIWTGVHTHDGNVLLGASATLKSADWASGVTGWGITPAGAADFRTLAAREIVAQAFVADIEQALAAGQVITKSVVLLAADFQVPAYSGATTVAVEPLPSWPLVDVFTAGDILRLRVISRSAGLEVADCYVQVGTQVSKDAAGQVWNVTRLADPDGGSATAGMVVHRGAVVLDYGQSGDGYWEVTCLDAAGAPYAQVATWETTPSNATVRTRIGQLSGIFSEGPEWGLFAGDHAAGNYLRASGDGLAIHLGDGHIELDATGITVDGDQDEVNTQTGMRWVSPSTGRRVARLSAGPWGADGFPLVGLYANDLREHENSHVRLKAQGGSSPFTYGDIAMACYSTYTAVGLMAQFAADPLDSHAATLDVVSQNGALWPAHVRINIDTIVQFRVTADNVEVSPPLDLFSSTTWNNGVTLRAKNAAGTVENWMWPRYSDDYMYTNFGAAGWKIRTNASGIVLTFDADGDATFARTVTSTLGFSGPGVTSGSNPGHTHTAYSLTSHNHSGVYAPAAQGVTNGDAHDHSGGDGAQIDHGALGGRADDDHTQYLLASGARALSANWDAGSYYIRASYFYSDVATGTRPLVCTSTTTCTNLNADLLDGNHASAFATSGHTHSVYVERDGTTALTGNWDAGSYQIRASTFYSDVATGTKPITVASTTVCGNLNADLLDGNHASAFATSGHTHTTLGGLTTSGELRASYNGATVSANTTSGGSTAKMVWYENGAYKYGIEYVTTSDKWFCYSGPRATTIWEILDSGTDIRANTNWVSNAFDWVCGACGWHGADRPGGIGNAGEDLCPECGGRVEWHDDAELLHLAVHQPRGVALDRMEKLGVLSRHEDGQVFMALQTAHLFSWSAIAQLWERLRVAEARVAVLEGRL